MSSELYRAFSSEGEEMSYVDLVEIMNLNYAGEYGENKDPSGEKQEFTVQGSKINVDKRKLDSMNEIGTLTIDAENELKILEIKSKLEREQNITLEKIIENGKPIKKRISFPGYNFFKTALPFRIFCFSPRISPELGRTDFNSIASTKPFGSSIIIISA